MEAASESLQARTKTSHGGFFVSKTGFSPGSPLSRTNRPRAASESLQARFLWELLTTKIWRCSVIFEGAAILSVSAHFCQVNNKAHNSYATE